MNFEDMPPSLQKQEPSSAPRCYDDEGASAQRLHERLPFNVMLNLCWEQTKGVKRRIRAQGIDRSKFGVLVEAERPIPAGTIIVVESASFVVLGKASVRHCAPKGINYRIGLYMPDILARDL